MTNVPKDDLFHLSGQPVKQLRFPRRLWSLRLSTTKLILLLLCALLLCGGIATYTIHSGLSAANNLSRSSCSWRTVTVGDTLTRIAHQYHTTISALVNANAIRNANLIFVGQRLCIPHARGSVSSSGMKANGEVIWYAYSALDWSNRAQVRQLLYKVAAIHGLPPRLLLAVAWQESGWTQHVIAWDGGIGVMQLMPYTAMSINSSLGQRLDPYKLWDNLNLGAIYLKWLWRDFNGNLTRVISAYNQGGWAVVHQGIFNWSYVNNVLALMNSLE